MFNFYLSSTLIFTKYQQDLNASSRIDCLKNISSKVRSDLCKDAGIGGGNILVSTLPISGCGGEV